jgi:hypothetical protein
MSSAIDLSAGWWCRCTHDGPLAPDGVEVAAVRWQVRFRRHRFALPVT